VHAEDPHPGDLTLGDLVASGQLVGARADLLSVPPRIRTSDPQTRAVLGYLSANCAHCHNGRGEIAAFGPTIRVPDLVADGDAAARTLIGQPTKWQVPGLREGASVLVDPGSPDTSAIVARMRSRRPSSQMPPLGTVVRDEAAVALVAGWVTRTKTLVQSH
jgi:mono/diheme cytochrome c family protein